jgi:hypothetical protein
MLKYLFIGLKNFADGSDVSFGPGFRITHLYKFEKGKTQVSRRFGSVPMCKAILTQTLCDIIVPYPLLPEYICTIKFTPDYRGIIFRSACEYIETGFLELRADAIRSVRKYYAYI